MTSLLNKAMAQLKAHCSNGVLGSEMLGFSVYLFIYFLRSVLLILHALDHWGQKTSLSEDIIQIDF